MKRKDAFHKLRTICQRLDELSPAEFNIQPLRLYLFGSALTDKPDPKDIDLVLTYEFSPEFDFERLYADMVYGRSTVVERLRSQLRRGMQMIRLVMVRDSLDNWQDNKLLLFTQPRLIWKPGGNWPVVMDQIETAPLPWPGPRPTDVREATEALIKAMPQNEYQAKLTQVLAEVEGQDL